MIIKKHKINDQIKAKEVRVQDSEKNQLGIMELSKALAMAEEQELDLVEITDKANPPVVRIMDYNKFVYEEKKKVKEQQKAQQQSTVHLKEIKMRPKIDKHDYEFKFKHIQKFLSKGDKVKVTLQFRGREMAHIDLGEKILDTLKTDLGDTIVIEKEPKLEGRQIVMIVAPNKAK